MFNTTNICLWQHVKYYKLFNNNSYLLFTANTRVVFEQDHLLKDYLNVTMLEL